MEIIIRRTALKDGYTIGNLYILPKQAANEDSITPTQTINKEKAVPEWFCNTMEPTARKLTSQMPQTVIRRHKIIGKTAIPTGRYRILITRSRRFGRWLPLLMNVKGFEGIRIHPGNKPEDTRGCILLGFNRRKGYVLDSTRCVLTLVKMMTEAMEKGEKVFVEVR